MTDRNGPNGTNGDQTMRIAINGLGRIGKLVIRAFVDEGLDADIVLLNDVAGDAAVHAHLLAFDTVHGRWDADLSAPDADTIAIGSPPYPLYPASGAGGPAACGAGGRSGG